ncbi:MAG: class II aldolase/adducin family protein [Rickettsiaceae bacterium]|nr:class II aldolase/adducin family protein [Rickettsiaceae bacterium]
MSDEIIKEELALAYKILAYLELDDHTYTHLSSLSSDKSSYYIYPFGLKFCEVTSDSLIRADLNGNILEGLEYHYNKTGYIIHSSIYKVRSDITSIFHIHTPEIVAVSATKEGLMPISQWALHFYDQLSYSDYNSLSLQNDDGATIAGDLGKNYNILLRNHGSITCGRTIYEALFYTYHLQLACKTQVLALSQNRELVMPSLDICTKSVSDLLSFEASLGKRDWDAWARFLDKNPRPNKK